jgi:hypothetical protein
MTAVIEIEQVERDYGLAGTVAIVETSNHKRFLIRDGFGGIDTLAGGAVRWKHGAAYELQPGDTLESLRSTAWNEEVTLYDAVLHGRDDSRPVVEFHPECFARSAGLID